VRALLAAPIFAVCFSVLAQGASLPDSYYIHEQKPLCKFQYDEKLETVSLQILQQQLTSDGAHFYDGSKPIVTVCRKKAILMFGGTLMPEGRHLLDPPHIFIDVDVCSHQILAVDRDDGISVTNDPPCA
jgi:hypothetical protein